VEVLHPAVRHAELHHCLELLRNHGLLGIGARAGASSGVTSDRSSSLVWEA
jgi:hypothetical protein